MNLKCSNNTYDKLSGETKCAQAWRIHAVIEVLALNKKIYIQNIPLLYFNHNKSKIMNLLNEKNDNNKP